NNQPFRFRSPAFAATNRRPAPAPQTDGAARPRARPRGAAARRRRLGAERDDHRGADDHRRAGADIRARGQRAARVAGQQDAAVQPDRRLRRVVRPRPQRRAALRHRVHLCRLRLCLGVRPRRDHPRHRHPQQRDQREPDVPAAERQQAAAEQGHPRARLHPRRPRADDPPALLHRADPQGLRVPELRRGVLHVHLAQVDQRHHGERGGQADPADGRVLQGAAGAQHHGEHQHRLRVVVRRHHPHHLRSHGHRHRDRQRDPRQHHLAAERRGCAARLGGLCAGGRPGGAGRHGVL
ncbi:hypothetical protein DFJ74DRAFT_765053, partial [Hyaloraphidium curvatum]